MTDLLIINFSRTVKLVQEPLAVDIDVKKVTYEDENILLSFLLGSFLLFPRACYISFHAGSLLLLQDKWASNLHEGIKLDPSSRLA